MIVWSHREEKRDTVKANERHQTVADVKFTIFQHPNKVALSEGNMLTGCPKDNHHQHILNKRYYRWRTIGSYGFLRSANGLPIPYQCHRGVTVKDYWRSCYPKKTLEFFEEDSDLGEAFRNAAWETFGIRNVRHIWPGMDIFDMDNPLGIPLNLKSAFRLGDPQEFTAAVFGKRRVTRRLTEAVVNSEPWFVAYAHQFRGQVTDASLTTFLETQKFDDRTQAIMRPQFNTRIRKALLAMDPLCMQTIFDRDITAEDVLRIKDVDILLSRHGSDDFWLKSIPAAQFFNSWEEFRIKMWNYDVYVSVDDDLAIGFQMW